MADKAHNRKWVSIPSLPCASIEETLSFWEMLGFEITYKQTRPYQYGVVERDGSELHFGHVKGMEAVNYEYSGCLVLVPHAEKVYQEFTARFKEKLGKVPHSGIPRISRMKPGTARFTLTDVSGNSIIFVDSQEIDKDQETYKKPDDKNQSPLQKSIAMAIRFRDYKEDVQAAAKTLDIALRKAENEDKNDIAEAWILRLDLATFMNKPDLVQECRTRLKELGLTGQQLKSLFQKHDVRF